MRNVILVICLSIPIYIFAQNSAVTDFRESHETALSLYFYPSTLRMINLERNPEFDEMIRHIKKARFYKLDSGIVTNDDLQKLMHQLIEQGFEEIMFIKNKEMDLRVFGKDSRIPETIYISKNQDEVLLLEVNGMINVAKIPKIFETFNQNSFLNVMNLGETKN